MNICQLCFVLVFECIFGYGWQSLSFCATWRSMWNAGKISWNL